MLILLATFYGVALLRIELSFYYCDFYFRVKCVVLSFPWHKVMQCYYQNVQLNLCFPMFLTNIENVQLIYIEDTAK